MRRARRHHWATGPAAWRQALLSVRLEGRARSSHAVILRCELLRASKGDGIGVPRPSRRRATARLLRMTQSSRHVLIKNLHRVFEIDRDQLRHAALGHGDAEQPVHPRHRNRVVDRKSTRLNSSHQIISYAVFCLKKKKTTDY